MDKHHLAYVAYTIVLNFQGAMGFYFWTAAPTALALALTFSFWMRSCKPILITFGTCLGLFNVLVILELFNACERLEGYWESGIVFN